MNIYKESRKNISLTLGKGLDLRFWPRGICTNVATAGGTAVIPANPPGGPLAGWRTSLFEISP